MSLLQTTYWTTNSDKNWLIRNLSNNKERLFITNPYYRLSKELITAGKVITKTRFLTKVGYKNIGKFFTKPKTFGSFKRKTRELLSYNLCRQYFTLTPVRWNLARNVFSSNSKVSKLKTQYNKSLRSTSIPKTLWTAKTSIKGKKLAMLRHKVQKKKLHTISLRQIKVKVRKLRFFYQFLFKFNSRDLTKFIKNINNNKVKNSLYLIQVLKNIFSWIPISYLIKYLNNTGVFVNRTLIKSNLFLLLKGDIIECTINKHFFLQRFYLYYLRSKYYSFLMRKKWKKYLKKKIPLVKKKWKDYSIQTILVLDKFQSLLNVTLQNKEFQRNIEFDIKTMTISIIANITNENHVSNNYFEKLFCKPTTSYKFLNWKFIN